MQCAACGRQIPDNVAFCPYCAAATGLQPPPPAHPYPQAPRQMPPPGQTNPWAYTPPTIGGFEIIPTATNPLAVMSRMSALVAFVPCFALVSGPVAILTGVGALMVCNRNPNAGFRGSALFGIITGAILFLLNLAAVLYLWLGPHG